jgi:plasmid stabilization system protein ParE
MRVRITRTARRDLRNIRAFYLESSPRTADRVRREILAAINLLAARPGIGLPHGQDSPALRSKLVLNYPFRIHYRVGDNAIEILHIRHTARRDWSADDL